MGTEMEPIDDEEAIMDAANEADGEEGNNAADGDADEVGDTNVRVGAEPCLRS